MQISPIHYNYINSVSFGGSCDAHREPISAEEHIERYERRKSLYPKPYFFYEKSCKTPDEYGGLQKGQILDSQGVVFNRNFTTYSRNDLNWVDFGNYLKEKFNNPEDVNFSVFGCSSGEEAYTLAILLKHCYPQSDFKINAYDIDGELIDKNKINQKNGVVMSISDYNKISRDLSIKSGEMRKYFDNSTFGNFVLDKDITDRVNFEQANILTEIDNLDSSKPTVMFCRNMWPYIDCIEYDDFARKLYDKLASGSLVVIGGYDHFGESRVSGSDLFPSVLVDNNFKSKYRGLGKSVSLLKNEQVVVYER